MIKGLEMKSAKIELPARLHKKLKMWLLECDQMQSDMFCYLIDNLPPVPQFKPNSRLINYLKEYKNQVTLKKQYSTDDLKILDLVARGIIKPTPDEEKLIDKLLGPAK